MYMYYYIWTIVHCTLHRFDKKNYLGCKNEHTIWFKTQRPIFHITQVRLLIYLLGGADQEALLKPVRLVRGKFLWTVIPLEQTFYLHHTKYKFSITSVLFITHLYKTLSTGKLVLWNTKKPGRNYLCLNFKTINHTFCSAISVLSPCFWRAATASFIGMGIFLMA